MCSDIVIILSPSPLSSPFEGEEIVGLVFYLKGEKISWLISLQSWHSNYFAEGKEKIVL